MPSRLCISFTFVVTAVCIAPIAWWISSVEQKPLPSVDGIHRALQAVSFQTNVQILALDDSVHCPGLHAAVTLSNGHRVNRTQVVQRLGGADLEGMVRLAGKSDSSMVELDERLREWVGNFPGTTVFLIPDPHASAPGTFVAGSYRHAWLTLPSHGCGEAAKRISTGLQHMHDAGKVERTDVDSSLSTSYRLALSLLVPRHVDARASWPIQQSLHEQLDPMLRRLEPLCSFHVTSQVLYASRLSSDDGFSGRINTLTNQEIQRELQGFLSANDWKINSVADRMEKDLQFMLYVEPSAAEVPTRSFLIPRWGGVVVAGSGTGTHVSRTLMSVTMQHFVGHLRRLLGLKDCRSWQGQVQCVGKSNHGLTEWEYDSLAYHWFEERKQATVELLQSMATLVQEIPHMPISEQVQQQTIASLDGLHALANMSNETTQALTISRAMAQLRTSLTLANEVFYHPTLIPQLYFPEEHLIAVYIPLLAPLLLPILVGFVTVLRETRQ